MAVFLRPNMSWLLGRNGSRRVQPMGLAVYFGWWSVVGGASPPLRIGPGAPVTSATLMPPRRAALALTVVALLLASLPLDASFARASTVDEAERQADQAAAEVGEANQIVSSRVANRAEVEARLLDAMDRYAAASAAVESAIVRLDRLERTATSAADESVEVQAALEEQAVSAYIAAVTSTSDLVLGSDSAEEAMVTEQLFDAGSSRSMERLDSLTARRSELERLQVEYETERDRVQLLQQRLEQEADDLGELFAEADAAVAEAFERARAAEAEYRAALTEIDRAREAERRRRQEEADQVSAQQDATSTTTTATADQTESDPEDTSDVATTTTTTVPPDPTPPPPAGPAVERWRPLVSTHFGADLTDQALRILDCESNGDPNAVNPYSGASGLFQFLPSTWASASVRAGVGDRSVFDGEANIIAAAWLAEYYRANRGDPWLPWACRHHLG